MARCNDCYYCGGSHRRYVCPDFNAACARGKIHIDGDHRLCLGRSGDGNAPLSVPRGQPQKIAVQNAIRKLQEMKTAAPVHTSSVRLGAECDSDATTDTDEESGPALVEVLAARSDRQLSRYGTTHWQPLDKTASQLKGKAAKEDRLPTVKTTRPKHQAEVQTSEPERVRPVQPGLAVVIDTNTAVTSAPGFYSYFLGDRKSFVGGES